MCLRSNVVCKFTCQCCSAFYIRKTSRILDTRVCEHMSISAYTVSDFSNPTEFSSVLTHIRKTGHPNSFEDLSILIFGNSQFDVILRKSLLRADVSKYRELMDKHETFDSFIFCLDNSFDVKREILHRVRDDVSLAEN